MNHRRLQQRQLLESPHDLTVIVITHEPDITAYADRVLQFRDGELIKDSPQDRPSGLAVGGKTLGAYLREAISALRLNCSGIAADDPEKSPRRVRVRRITPFNTQLDLLRYSVPLRYNAERNSIKARLSSGVSPILKREL